MLGVHWQLASREVELTVIARFDPRHQQLWSSTARTRRLHRTSQQQLYPAHPILPVTVHQGLQLAHVIQIAIYCYFIVGAAT